MFQAFDEVLSKDLIPYIDTSFRAVPDRDHRALAGLSMGGMQAYTLGLGHLDLLSYIGGFSGAGGGFGGAPFDPKTAHNGVMADADAFNRRVHLLFLSVGTVEPQRMQDSVNAYHHGLTKAGIKTVYCESPGTSHEWLTWRRSLQDVIPTIESRYSVQNDQVHRALAGLSMGGGQSLNFGLAHLDTFAWVGGFSSAPNTRAPAELLPDASAAKDKLKLLWLSVGNKDGLIRISQGIDQYLKEKGVPHVWNVDGHAHDPTEWRNNLYYFLQKVFK
jgi:enterochelin esterase-like enzyme